jgi:hypothetical protein
MHFSGEVQYCKGGPQYEGLPASTHNTKAFSSRIGPRLRNHICVVLTYMYKKSHFRRLVLV